MPYALVTGAGRGIGLALCAELRSRGWTVAGTTRGPSPALDALEVPAYTLEVTDQASIDQFVRTLPERPIDLLIHNAGILRRDNLDDVESLSLVEQYLVNAVGPVLLTAALRSRLVEGSKIAIITSRMGSIADNSSGGMYGYRMSKAAVNMAGMSMARDLAADGVAVALLHPGMVKTDMVGPYGQVEPEDAAKGLVDRIEQLDRSTSGSFWHAQGEELPW